MEIKDFTDMLFDILEEYRFLAESPLRKIKSIRKTEDGNLLVRFPDGTTFQLSITT